MRKTITILLATVLLFSLFVSCNNGSVDDAFNCTVTFDGNGATSGEMSVQTVGIGIPTELNANTFGKTDFDFMWWTTEADGIGKFFWNRGKIRTTEDVTLYAQWGHLLSEESTAWTDGQVYSFDRNLTIAERITVSGNVTLILPDGYILTAAKGITVNEGNSLTVNAIGEGTGTVNAVVPEVDWKDPLAVCAAIGGNNCSSGSITINGGNVTATSTRYGAAIGGGYSGAGTVTINGGTVIATSGMYGAAIGGGNSGAGTVTINGGTVIATSGTYGAAIGGGDFKNGTVTINGGTITATTGDFGAGIGGGFGGNGTVIINGGTVTTSGNTGAGIGCGYTGSGGTVTINGGTVTAAGLEDGAGIGGAYNGSGFDVTINGGQVYTQGADGAAGIGRGRTGAGDGTLTLGEGVVLQVSDDNSNWSDYDGTTRQRYMRTK